MIRFFTASLPLVAALTVALLCPAAAVDPASVDVFVSGDEGYKSYRIPSVIRAKNGTLLAFCEARKNGESDSGDIDLVLKRSTDNGVTWGPLAMVWDDGQNTCGNPCPVVDESTGIIWLLMTQNIGTDKESAIMTKKATGSRTVWVTSSKDNGITWEAPRDITATAKDPEWSWYATGPGVGIQLTRGAHAGRLVIPSDYSLPGTAPSARAEQYGSHILYSDDHGASWKIGGRVFPKMNECQAVELADGTLLLNMRSYTGSGCRAEARSSDGGITFAPVRDVPQLPAPVCQASIIRLAGSGPLLYSGPADPAKRQRLTVRLSKDEAANWSELRVLHDGPASYSCLVALSADEAACLYECGTVKSAERIRYSAFSVSPE